MALRARVPLLVLASIALHAALLSAGRSLDPAPALAPLPEARSYAPAVLARARAARRHERLQEQRAAIVARAREERAHGALRLGRFLLATSRVDAEEAGIELDLLRAEDRYNERLSALRDALEDGDVAHAVPAVFGGLKYYGRPGGLMASALADGGGSCEQISQVVAAAVHDAGRPGEIALRYYGGLMEDGAAHLTPIALQGKVERDLMTGKIAAPGGLRIAAEELVEIYARAHGLAPNAPAPSPAAKDAPEPAAKADDRSPPRPTLLAGMPPNADRFPGSLPVYAAHALREPEDESGASFAYGDEQLARLCPFSVRLESLSPPSIAIEIPRGEGATFVEAEPRKIPSPASLERAASLLRAAETIAQRSTTPASDRLVSWACLAALGEIAAIDFELAGEHGAAADSVRAHLLGREKGKAALAAIDWSTEEGKDVGRTILRELGGQSWILLALEGGDRVVMDLAAHARQDFDSAIGLYAALLVWPATREIALPIVAARPLSEQLEIMQTVFVTTDRTRHLPGSPDLDAPRVTDPASVRFLTAYGVFRRLAARLWETEPPEATLTALTVDARAAGMGVEEEAALLDYYARNSLSLYSQRIEVLPRSSSRAATPDGPRSIPERSVTFAPSNPRGTVAAGPPRRTTWQRPGGMEVVRALRAAVERNAHPSLDRLRRSLLYIEAQGRLDPRTLADALRQD